MKFINQFLAIIYGGVAAYSIYMSVMTLFVYFANQSLGHSESFRQPTIYLSIAALFSVTTYIGYKIWANQTVHLLLKSFFYLPIIAVCLYILWGILMIVGSGGKWN